MIKKLKEYWFEIHTNNSKYLINSKSLQIYKLPVFTANLKILEIIEKIENDIIPILPPRNNKPNIMAYTFVLSNNCNLNCPYCSRDRIKSGAINGIVDKKTIDMAISYMFNRSYNKRYFDVMITFYGGEPLLVFNKIKMVVDKINQNNSRREKKIKIKYYITTNGTILNDDIINFSIKNQLSYAVSLDGIGRIHDITRKFKNGEPSYEIVKNNIFTLKKHNLLSGIITTISKYNMNNLTDLLDFIKSIGTNIRLQMIRFDDIKWSDNFIEEYTNAIYKALDYGIANKIKIVGDVNLPFYILNRSKELLYCPILNGTLVAIMPDGRLSQCQAYNVSDEISIESFITSDNFIVLKDKELILPECNECPLQFVCLSSCVADKLNSIEHNTCRVFKKLFEKIMNSIDESKYVKREKEII